jgi:hypothetical protein
MSAGAAFGVARRKQCPQRLIYGFCVGEMRRDVGGQQHQIRSGTVSGQRTYRATGGPNLDRPYSGRKSSAAAILSVRFFIDCSFPGRYFADALVFLGVTHHQNPVRARQAHREKSLFVLGMVGVSVRCAQRIVEYGDSLLERNPMLAPISQSFGRIPFKDHLSHFNASALRFHGAIIVTDQMPKKPMRSFSA